MKRKLAILILALTVSCAHSPLLAATYTSLEPQLQKEFNALLDEAFNSYINKDYTKSMKLFQRALQMVPGDKTAEKGFSESQVKLEDQQKEKMKIVRQRMSFVKEEIKKENWMEAIDHVHWLFANSINPAEVQALRVELETALRRKIDNFPVASADRLIFEGFVYYLNRNFPETLRAWKDASTMVSSNVKLTIYIQKVAQIYRETAYHEIVVLGGERAKEAFNSGNYEVSANLWKKIIEFDPQNNEALEGIRKTKELANNKSKEGLISDYYDKGLATFLEENYAESLKSWEGILSIDPANEVAKDYIAKIKAKGIVPAREIEKKVSPAFQQAMTLYEQEKYVASKELFLKVLEQNPKDREAEDWVEKIKKTQAQKAEEHYQKGLISYSQGNKDEALKEWEKALEIDPSHGPSQRTLLKVKGAVAK